VQKKKTWEKGRKRSREGNFKLKKTFIAKAGRIPAHRFGIGKKHLVRRKKVTKLPGWGRIGKEKKVYKGEHGAVKGQKRKKKEGDRTTEKEPESLEGGSENQGALKKHFSRGVGKKPPPEKRESQIRNFWRGKKRLRGGESGGGDERIN